MTKEEFFLKYIDDQLTQEEKLEVELLLSENDSNKQLFEKVKATRDEIVNALDFLNPAESVTVPTFDTSLVKSLEKKTFRIKLWHYAAMAAIIAGIYFSLKLFKDKKDVPVVEVATDELEISKTIYKELDCYISPNRCWNQKKLVWTFN
ncbi:MAG: hypothetical protein K8R68_02215 [Bacteroidales bacterium]|nr:hypothetical protein [Bacteroidales bacterium]